MRSWAIFRRNLKAIIYSKLNSMKKIVYSIALIAFFLTAISGNAQRRASLEKVDKKNPINGSPFIILPKTAIKLDFAMVEFHYTIGDKLRDLIPITDKKCKEEDIKKELKGLEQKYGVNAGILAKLLMDPKYDKDELVVNKLDKDIKTSFISMADYDKVYKYIRLKSLFNSSLLNLVYDENGVLVSSKRTDESKLVPTILSTLSGIAGIAGAVAKSANDNPLGTLGQGNKCISINTALLQKLDDLLEKYNSFLTAADIYNDKQFEAGSKKLEEDITKSIAELFYSKEVKITPMRMLFAIPKDENPKDGSSKKIELFEYDNVNHQIKYNKAYVKYISVSPSTKFVEEATITSAKAYTIELSEVQELYDRNASLSAFIGSEPEKKTAVFNIPKSEQFQLLKPGGKESYIDTTIKIPQHGSVGYLSLRLSSIELTYDTNGELKSMIAESKSSIDGSVTSGTTGIKELVTAFKGKTETEKLEEKAKMLELLKKIKDLETAEE